METATIQPTTIQHTPDTWDYVQGDTSDSIYRDENELCENVGIGLSDSDRHAVGKLIAAAPDLLEGLQDVVTAHDQNMGPRAVRLRIDRARAAIDRATAK